MPEILLLVLALLAAAMLGQGLVRRSNVIISPTRIRTVVGVLFAFFATLTLARGGVAMAAILGLASVTLLTGDRWQWRGHWQSSANEEPTTTRLVTDTLEVGLDHASGTIHGRIRRGCFQGRSLESLKPVELAHLWSDCRFADPQSAQIVEAYLDRVHPTWRDDMARTAEGMRSRGSSQMSRDEAIDILGLESDASETQIRRAHHELMLKLHPDKGGSHTLAAKVNQAKEALLGKS